jgi:hypothetical protein
VRLLRYAGLGATGLLAVGAFAAGALPGSDPAGVRVIAGVATALTGAVLLVIVWFRLRGAPVSPRWLLTTGALWAVPLLLAPPLASRDVYAYACQGALYLDGYDPYAVGATAGCPWLDAVPQVWRDSPAPYGPLALALSAAAAAAARALPQSENGQLIAAVGLLRLVAVGGLALLAAYGLRLARVTTVDGSTAIWLGVVTPLVAVHAISGGHNDALLAGLVVAGLALAADQRDTTGSSLAPGPSVGADPVQGTMGVLLAGAMFGLAVCVKVTALVVIPFAALLMRPRQAAYLIGAAAATFAALTALTGLGFGWLAALPRTGSLVQWTSPPTGIGMAAGYLLRVLGWPQAYEEAVFAARVIGLAVLAGVLVGLWWKARRQPRRAVVVRAGAALAATALLAPTFYPWYALTPLAVLALSTVDQTVRKAIGIATAVLVFLILPSGLGLAVLTKLPGALLDVVLLAGLAVWYVRRRAAPTTPTATG